MKPGLALAYLGTVADNLGAATDQAQTEPCEERDQADIDARTYTYLTMAETAAKRLATTIQTERVKVGRKVPPERLP